jgi:hypothetical protein
MGNFYIPNDLPQIPHHPGLIAKFTESNTSFDSFLQRSVQICPGIAEVENNYNKER